MKTILLSLAMVTALTGCSTFGPITATGSPAGKKMGTACNSWILAPTPLTTWGRNDIRAAADRGKIDRISIVDYETSWYLLYGETCTNVYGE